jgi:hypothetical protein
LGDKKEQDKIFFHKNPKGAKKKDLATECLTQ